MFYTGEKYNYSSADHTLNEFFPTWVKNVQDSLWAHCQHLKLENAHTESADVIFRHSKKIIFVTLAEKINQI